MVKKKLIPSALALISIVIICLAVIYIAYNVTSPIIKENAVKSRNAEIASYFPDALKIDECGPELLLEGVEAVYKASGNGYLIYSGANSGSGSVRVCVNLDDSGRIKSVKVLDAAEQPLTQAFKLKSESYTNQYKNAKAITSLKNKAGQRYIQPVAGAEDSSEAVFSAVAAALQQYESLIAAVEEENSIDLGGETNEGFEVVAE